MAEGAEAIGELVTGGMAARAVEPEAGGAGDSQDRGRCLNCGSPIADSYCGRCGQAAHVHRTLGAFWHDIAHSVLHFDGKIWRTLPLLAWRPGELTRRYVEGERAKFVSPMAMFLFSVFLMFAVVSAFGGPFDTTSATAPEDRAEALRDYEQERAEAEAKLKTLSADLEGARRAGRPTAPIQSEIDAAQLELRLQREAYELSKRLANDAEAREKKAAAAGKEPGSDFNLIGETGWAPFDRAVDKAEKNPSLLFYKLQTNAYKFSWALIPISVPFLWLLFLHRRRYRRYKAYDHIVFVTYSIAFMSIGFIVLTLLRPLGVPEAVAGLAMTFVPPIHMYRQLRGAYQLSRWSALWRTFLLLNFAFVAAGLFLTLLVTLGVFG